MRQPVSLLAAVATTTTLLLHGRVGLVHVHVHAFSSVSGVPRLYWRAPHGWDGASSATVGSTPTIDTAAVARWAVATPDADGDGPSGGADSEGVKKEAEPELTDADWSVVDQILAGDSAALEARVASALPTMHPRLVLRLRSAADEDGQDGADDDARQDDDDARTADLRTIGNALKTILDSSLKSGRDLLATLLETGEIRKLDSEIGRASRDGKLDMAFFTVLNMNIRDAQYEASRLSEEERAKLVEITTVPTDSESGTADRLQILQHVYTRCQEEVEKNVDPGVGLLNKLLRTDDASIRANQLRHYLGPQANVVVTPDGTEVPLKRGTTKPALVPPSQLIDALGNAVRQIRTVEQAGGTDRLTAANLVESCRQVAIEARMAIGESYGMDSDELQGFEEGLQPVFRPGGTESEFVKGN